MSLKKIEHVSALSDEERLAFFVRNVADFEEIWGAYDDGWSMLGSEANRLVIPFWPGEDFAQAYISSNKLSAKPKGIEVAHFLDNWVAGMEKDEAKICVFPVADKSGLVVEPSHLALLIKEEMAQYE